MVQLDLANSLIKFQKSYDIQGYYLIKLKIAETMASYVAHPEFAFCERFNEIIHWIKSAGLFTRWWQLELAEEATLIAQANLKHSGKNKEIGIERFTFPMLTVYGWIISIIVFFIEIIWNIFVKKFWSTFVGKLGIFNRVFAKNT